MFNYCVGNPAFNIAEKNNVAGTGGNTTLYKTATRNDFENRLAIGGTLTYITLKGIIPDLISGYFKDYQVDYIHLMDNIDVWPYNTCFFSVRKLPRVSKVKIAGGLAAKIFSPYPNECFPFIYYSGSNTGMDKQFSSLFPNRVIRQLPGRGRDKVSYDFTSKSIEPCPKFAFYVLESKKSYTVTSDPIYGGTICYIPTKSIQHAEKLKLFVEKNPVYAEYVKRMKFKGHAFGLRNVKWFDLDQIITGAETPVEWNINDSDLQSPAKFENNISEDRDRVKALGEVFTPTQLVKFVLDYTFKDNNSIFTDPSTTFIDSMCGDGQFLIEVADRKIKNHIPVDAISSSIAGIDLTQENIDLCSRRLKTMGISNTNLLCADSLTKVLTK